MSLRELKQGRDCPGYVRISLFRLPKGTRLLKAYATTKQGPRRILYLLVVQERDLFVLCYRAKQDDVGANMSPKNSAFNRALTKYLDLLRDDLASGRIEEITPDKAGAPV